MSAMPPFHQFQHAPQAKPGSPGRPHDGGEASETTRSRTPDGAQADEAQGSWSYVRPLLHDKDAAETDAYPRSFRLLLIGVLSLTSWGLVLGAGRIVIAVLH